MEEAFSCVVGVGQRELLCGEDLGRSCGVQMQAVGR